VAGPALDGLLDASAVVAAPAKDRPDGRLRRGDEHRNGHPSRHGVSGDPRCWEARSHRKRPSNYSPELRARSVRTVTELTPDHPSQYAGIIAVAPGSTTYWKNCARSPRPAPGHPGRGRATSLDDVLSFPDKGSGPKPPRTAMARELGSQKGRANACRRPARAPDRAVTEYARQLRRGYDADRETAGHPKSH
jgi:hypothetical protein